MSWFRWFKYLASNLLTGCTKIVILVYLLGGCSPAPETEGDLAVDSDNPDSYSQGLLDEGWRKGKLEIRFELAQAANTMEAPQMMGKLPVYGIR